MDDKIREAFGKEMFFLRNVETESFEIYKAGYKSRDTEIKKLQNLLQDISDAEGITPGIIQLQEQLDQAVELLDVIHGQLPEGLSHLKKAIEEQS